MPLINSFNKTKLDLTDNSPINVPENKHEQKYTPVKQYDPNGIPNDNLSKLLIRLDGVGESNIINVKKEGKQRFNHKQHYSSANPYLK